MTKKVMRLIDKSTGLMECKVCGDTHFANLRGGKYIRGSWQCKHACRLEDCLEISAYELNGQTLCSECYVEATECNDVDDREKHLISKDKARAKWPEQGNDIYFPCDKCGNTINYEIF